MYKIIALLLIAVVVADATDTCVAPFCYRRFSCTSNHFCHKAGYIAYPYDNRVFCYCSGQWRNAGCQRCPANLVYSQPCGQCLNVYDALEGHCSSVSPDNGSNSVQSCVNADACQYKSDGVHIVPTDNTKFFFCDNHTPTQCQNCPAGLIFSDVCKVCVNSEADCNKDGGPNGGPNGQIPTPPCAMNKNCWDLEPGWYNFPNIGEASRYYFYCNEKFQNAGCQTCPANLYYSATCKQCLSREAAENDECFVSGGGNGGSNTANFCAPENFCSDYASHRPASFLFAVEGENKDNTKFFSCVNGQATQCQSCAADLVFNEVCQACMRFKTDKAEECGVKKTEEEGKTDEGTGPSDVDVPRCDDYLCHGKAAGNYEQDSPSEKYITCLSDGKCIKQSCQNAGSGLVFSVVCNSCNFRYITNKESCNEAPPTPPTTPRVSMCKEAATFCNGKLPDISHSPPEHSGESNQIFYKCDKHGFCFRFKCQGNLVYREEKDACDWPNHY